MGPANIDCGSQESSVGGVDFVVQALRGYPALAAIEKHRFHHSTEKPHLKCLGSSAEEDGAQRLGGCPGESTTFMERLLCAHHHRTMIGEIGAGFDCWEVSQGW